MTYAPTGGIVAAITTSLPEHIGGVRNWDYRFCWLRDATFTLYSLLASGYTEEALAWRAWLLRAVAGDPGQFNIMYGALLRALEADWRNPDEGIWEVRGPRRHFTHSKVMAWVAFDRAVKAVETYGREGPVDRWRASRDELHAEICARGFDPEVGAFMQSYGSKLVDASVLMMPLVGFLPATDARMRSTIEVIERRLMRRGFVDRYETTPEVDGLPVGEGAFLACSFWLVDCLSLLGRHDDACALFERLLAIRNDVGLLSEEYDPEARRLLGNFPQAFSHVSLVNSAINLSRDVGPALDRRRG